MFDLFQFVIDAERLLIEKSHDNDWMMRTLFILTVFDLMVLNGVWEVSDETKTTLSALGVLLVSGLNRVKDREKSLPFAHNPLAQELGEMAMKVDAFQHPVRQLDAKGG